MRAIPAGMAAVRASLRHGAEPAAWAVLEVTPPGGGRLRGIADERGEVVVILPWPPLARSTRTATAPPLAGQTWALGLRALYTPRSPVERRPDVCTLLRQRPAERLARASTPGTDLSEATLSYGSELVLHELQVTPRP
jgi:hypothetical protein